MPQSFTSLWNSLLSRWSPLGTLVSAVAFFLLGSTSFHFLSAQEIREDEVVLHSGQSLFGSVSEIQTANGKDLQVQMEDGWTLILDRKSYLRWKPEPQAMPAYRKALAQAQWTLEDQLKLAQWCDENHLKEKAQYHYRIARQIDPDNELASKKLGYSNRSGIWIHRDELKRRLGYQRTGSKWELPEIKQLRTLQQQQKETEVKWTREVKSLIEQSFRPGRNQQVSQNRLLALNDPAAVPELIKNLEDAEERILKANSPAAQQLAFQKQQVLIRVLCNIDSYGSSKQLAKFYLTNQNDPESRDLALETLLKRKSYQQVLMNDFQVGLSPKFEIDGKPVTDPDLNTSRLGRAAYGLEQIGVPYAIEELIQALQVTYTKVSQTQGNTSFGSNGSTNVNPGGSTVVQKQVRTCQEALDTLRAFTRQDFQFDQMAWVQWWVLEKTPVNLDLRRDR